ncbi:MULTISPECIES: hypothetical protein [unclassified Streptomyces]
MTVWSTAANSTSAEWIRRPSGVRRALDVVTVVPPVRQPRQDQEKE